MNKILFLFLLLLGLCSCVKGYADELTGRAVSVHDGDTFVLLCDDGTWCKIRMYGIDAPELLQTGEFEAYTALHQLIDEKRVTVDITGLDNHGTRKVGKVYIGKSKKIYVNLQLVQRGLVWWYKDFARNDKELQDAQEAAEDGKLGIWANDSPVAPWDYRKAQKNKDE